MKFTKAQQRVLDLMKTTGKPLVKRRYRVSGRDMKHYLVGDKLINNKTGDSLVEHLEGGALENEAMGNVRVRRYTLPAEKSE